MIDTRKVAVIGCGFVGSACAFTLMQHGLFSEMVLIDLDQARAEGEAMDISHGLLFAKPMNIYAGTYADAADADIAIVTAGANQKPGETRLDLVRKNSKILISILDELKKSTSGADNMRAQIKDYLEDAAKAKLAAEEARREVERLRRELGYLKEQK